MSRKKKTTAATRRPTLPRRLFFLSLASMLALPLLGCGRKASPDKPKGSKYPREYPSP